MAEFFPDGVYKSGEVIFSNAAEYLKYESAEIHLFVRESFRSNHPLFELFIKLKGTSLDGVSSGFKPVNTVLPFPADDVAEFPDRVAERVVAKFSHCSSYCFLS